MRRPSGTSASPHCMMTWVGLRVMSCPSNVTAPLLACGEPQIVISKVLLPAPLAPIRVTISPGCTSSDTPLSASIWP